MKSLFFTISWELYTHTKGDRRGGSIPCTSPPSDNYKIMVGLVLFVSALRRCFFFFKQIPDLRQFSVDLSKPRTLPAVALNIIAP